MPTATGLEAKLNAFRTALRDQDVNGALKDQRELAAAANEADAALQGDKSPQAQAVRAAIGEIRQAIGGDTNGLDHADTALRQVIGGASTVAELSSDTSTAGGVVDLKTLAEDVRSFRGAITSKNAGEALRLQGKLTEEIGPVQKVAAADKSDDGKALNNALGLLQKGLAGDPMSLATGGDELDRLAGPASGTAGAPDYAGLAASLAAKMDAFSTATSTASQSDLLRLQQEILNEATQDETALGNDQSPDAVALRTAIKDARATASGDLSKLPGARADLGKISGQATPGTTNVKPITDLKGFATDLDGTIAAFQVALQKNDTGSMLKLQKALADQADQADANLKGVQSRPAQQVLAAVDAVRASFAGDTTKLADARVQLREVTAAANAPGAANPAAGAAYPAAANSAAAAAVDKAAAAAADKAAAVAANNAATATANNAAAATANNAAAAAANKQPTAGATYPAAGTANNPAAGAAYPAAGAANNAAAGAANNPAAGTATNPAAGAATNPAAGAANPAAGQAQPPANANFDAQQVAGGVAKSLTTLNQSAQDPHQSADDIAKKRDAVNQEATKAEAALHGVNDPRADQIRSALTAAREAAAGDNAKAQTALDQLQSATNH